MPYVLVYVVVRYWPPGNTYIGTPGGAESVLQCISPPMDLSLLQCITTGSGGPPRHGMARHQLHGKHTPDKTSDALSSRLGREPAAAGPRRVYFVPNSCSLLLRHIKPGLPCPPAEVKERPRPGCCTTKKTQLMHFPAPFPRGGWAFDTRFNEPESYDRLPAMAAPGAGSPQYYRYTNHASQQRKGSCYFDADSHRRDETIVINSASIGMYHSMQ